MGASDSRLPPASARAAGRLQSRETAVASLNSFIQQTLNEDQHIRKACMSNQPQCPSQASRVELALSSLEVRWLEKFRSVGLFYSFFKDPLPGCKSQLLLAMTPRLLTVMPSVAGTWQSLQIPGFPSILLSSSVLIPQSQ
ncbi:uncharacterized protein LOC144382717 isoform X2 [Halichoerus grypus]